MHDIWVLRHGESSANVAGLIVSAAAPRALIEVGLTELGREQARDAAHIAAEHGLDAEAIVITSDFARARETAEVFAATLAAPPPRLEQRLRERSFGIHDEGPVSTYETVWASDRERALHQGGVEPVIEVAQRVQAVLHAADELARHAPVVLVAHGDVLQIILALGAAMDAHDHRQVPQLGNAELRRIGPGRALRSHPDPAGHQGGGHQPGSGEGGLARNGIG